MTAEEFLEYVDASQCYRDKGKARLNRARALYQAYIEAYRETSWLAFTRLCFLNRVAIAAVRKAAEDKDAGSPMVNVPELL